MARAGGARRRRPAPAQGERRESPRREPRERGPTGERKPPPQRERREREPGPSAERQVEAGCGQGPDRERPQGQPRRREPVLGELLYGRNAILEALRAGRRRAYYLAVARGVQRAGTLAEILELAAGHGVPLREVDRRDLDDLAPGNQGVALEVSEYPYDELDALTARVGPDSLFLLLDCIEDPQNLGTLLRTAEAVQVVGVVIPAHRAVGVTPAVSNASAGAVEHLGVAQVANLVQAMETLRQAGVWLAGLEDVPEATVYDQADWRGPTALVVGSEGRGMRRLVREHCDYLVRLPMAGRINSLNAAVAGSIALYHAWRTKAVSLSAEGGRQG